MNPARKAAFHAVLWAVPIFAVALVLTLFVREELNIIKVQALSKVSEVNADKWSSYFTQQLPATERAFAEGSLTPEQVAIFRSGFALGEAFGVKLFKPDGAIFYCSFTPGTAEAAAAEIATAQEAFARGEPIVDLHEGERFPEFPPRYARVYVPLQGVFGQSVGVMEIYLDQTQIASTLTQGFQRIILLLPLLCGAALLIPALAFAFVKGQNRAQEEDLDAARFDALTKTLNRRGFEEAQSALYGRIAGTKETVAVMFIDLDEFKVINDTLGHAAGDAFLSHVADRIRENLRDRDIVGRFGGDEFVVLLPGIGMHHLRSAGERILTTISRPLPWEGQTIEGAVSIGATLSDGTDRFDTVLARADDALYNAKKSGRNRMRICRPDGEIENITDVA